MKNPAPTINVYGMTVKAALCYKCGARIFPIEELDNHLKRHDLRAEVFRHGSKKPARPWERNYL